MEDFHIDTELRALLVDTSEEDLEALMELHEDPTNDNQIEMYIYLCFLLWIKSKGIERLEQAKKWAEGWVAVTPADHPDHNRRLSILNTALAWGHQYVTIAEDIGTRASRTANTEFLIEMKRLTGEVIRLLQNFERTRRLEYLNQAIETAERVMSLAGDRVSPSMLTGSLEDLNQAVSVTSDAVAATTHNHPDRAACLSNLGTELARRFNWTGLIDDLNQAIIVTDRLASMSNLGSWLSRRFERTGSMDDLNRAIDVLNEAINATTHSPLTKAGCLGNLGGMLARRFERAGSMDDLNRAVSLATDALDLIPHNHMDRAKVLNTLSVSTDDLNQSVIAASDAIKITPQNDPFRAVILNSLAIRFHWRFISMSSDAVDAVPHDHPERAHYLRNLGNKLGSRFDQTGLIDDLYRQLSSYIASWECLAANILISQQDWEKSYKLLHDAISVLPTVSPRDIFGLASSAAATALSAGKTAGDALRLLELGRGVIASLVMDMRGDITDLQVKHSDLAERFRLLRDELDSPAQNSSVLPTDKVSSWELRAKRRREADKEFTEVINAIRAQPGFSNFLQPPAIEELVSAADQGPIVVVNISSFRCDAFLVELGFIRTVELPEVTQEELAKRISNLKTQSGLLSLLEWLWQGICRPCLDTLKFTKSVLDDSWPHIWWIPSGILSQVPLHAAGIYRQASKETVMDRVMSSYASSIKALLHGRKHTIQNLNQLSRDESALMVAMQDTPGLGKDGCLHFANAEVDMLTSLCRELQLVPVTPSRRKDDVLEHLPKCKLFHFAGHGQSDPRDPSQSCLLLEDWETNPLTVGEVRNSRLQDNSPFLAYLSACSTGSTKAIKLTDEGIHLINAFQLAGFRHVVGTLWEVSDKHCVEVAKVLYETLQKEGMTDVAVSRGLHRAVRALRNGEAEVVESRDAKLISAKPQAQGVADFFWVPYIHFGV
ncbi:CHAT domain-containing protein [Trichoderma chlorosporum]